MNCNDIKDNVFEYLEGSLDKEKQEQFNNHIEKCQECKKELEELKQVVEHLEKNSEEITVPHDFMINIRNNEKDINKKIKKSRRKLISGFLIASILTLFVMTAFASEGFDVIEWLREKSLKESESIEELINKGYGQKLGLSAEDNDVRITVESVIADDINTLLLMEIVDLKGETKYEPNYSIDKTFAYGKFLDDSLFINNEQEIKDKNYVDRSFIFYTPENHINKMIATINPVSSSEEIIELNITELKSMDRSDDKILEGNWNFTIPVKRFESYKFELNQEMDLDGNTITIEELVIAPTMTTLTYSYIENQNSEYVFRGLKSLSLEADGGKYNNSYGANYQYSDGNIRRIKDNFDSMYFNIPEKITIKVDGYSTFVYQAKTLDIDMDKEFPQKFEYLNEPIIIENVEVSNGNTRIVIREKCRKKKHKRLEFEVHAKNNSLTKYSVESGSYYKNSKGKIIAENEFYILDREKQKKYTHFENRYEILLENFFSENESIAKGYPYSDEIIPKRIFITGYREIRDKASEITIKLTK